MQREQLEMLEKLQQYPHKKGVYGELSIHKNDPKNGNSDHWCCSYGDISLSGYYSLPKMLSDFIDECIKYGYIELPENALIK
jgi:hypothetical protein